MLIISEGCAVRIEPNEPITTAPSLFDLAPRDAKPKAAKPRKAKAERADCQLSLF